jgi:SPP1 gp7 family putative phage head morphogenesis protein
MADKTIKGKFKPSPSAERAFLRALKKVARVSGHLVESHVDGVTIKNLAQMKKALKDYSELIGPWAQRQSAKLFEQVQKSNKRAYTNKSKAIGVALEHQVAEQDVGAVAYALMNEQVALIKSIPIEAGQRAQEIAFNAALEGKRAIPNQSVIDQLKKELGMSTEVATNRAKLIARTETARANASINQARAMKIGSNQYRWHNSDDGAVRHSHRVYQGRAIQGRIFSWDAPPTLSDGMRGHPGTFPNCRCFAEPIFQDE